MLVVLAMGLRGAHRQHIRRDEQSLEMVRIMTRAQIRNKQFVFSSFLAEAKFFELTEGREVIITIDDAPTANMRRFFEGAVVPSVFFQNPKSGWENFKDAREALKLEFCSGYTKDLWGNSTRYARSTTELSKKKFTEFLEGVTHWMEENGMESPDPEDYKRWKDSAPSPGEIYPPLLRLKERYNDANATRTRRTRTRHNKKPRAQKKSIHKKR